MSDLEKRFTVGDQPGKGIYMCLNCKMKRKGLGESVVTHLVTKEEPKLPPCPTCGDKADWMKGTEPPICQP